MGYAAVVGEALIDLLDGECEGERIYRIAVGGAPLNVAVGIAKLGGAAEFVGSLSSDALGERIRQFLTDAGVGTRNVATVDAYTTLAVTTFTGTEPDFAFYGNPPSYGLFGPDDLDEPLVGGAAVVYCGSIALLAGPSLVAARAAWAVPGPLKTFDPNARPRLLSDVAGYRAVVEEFAGGADLVKMSSADADLLWGAEALAVARRFSERAPMVLTRGAAGALLLHNGQEVEVPPAKVNAIDATGAGDATMAGLLYGLLVGATDWPRLVAFALAVAGLTCEGRGGATAMPTLQTVRERFPEVAQIVPSSSA
jgi:sugar/nucleoside kinase (ribokinase family)